MILPHTDTSLIVLMILCMLCWGTWPVFHKMAKKYRFELFYFDFGFGLGLMALVCAFTFLCDALNANENGLTYPALGALAARCEALPEFQATRVEFVAPSS